MEIIRASSADFEISETFEHFEVTQQKDLSWLLNPWQKAKKLRFSEKAHFYVYIHAFDKAFPHSLCSKKKEKKLGHCLFYLTYQHDLRRKRNAKIVIFCEKKTQIFYVFIKEALIFVFYSPVTKWDFNRTFFFLIIFSSSLNVNCLWIGIQCMCVFCFRCS